MHHNVQNVTLLDVMAVCAITTYQTRLVPTLNVLPQLHSGLLASYNYCSFADTQQLLIPCSLLGG